MPQVGLDKSCEIEKKEAKMQRMKKQKNKTKLVMETV